MTDQFRGEQPKSDPKEAASSFAQLWMAMAKEAANIAASKRAIYLAYVAEGFTEAQALELVKTI